MQQTFTEGRDRQKLIENKSSQIFRLPD